MYEIFGKYGAIRQIRVAATPETKGTAYVVYEDIYDAKNACEHLSGFNVGKRYLVVLYYNPSRSRVDVTAQTREVEALRKKVAEAEAGNDATSNSSSSSASASSSSSSIKVEGGDDSLDEEDRTLRRRR